MAKTKKKPDRELLEQAALILSNEAEAREGYGGETTERFVRTLRRVASGLRRMAASKPATAKRVRS